MASVLCVANPFCDQITRIHDDFLHSHELTKGSGSVTTEREKFDSFWFDAVNNLSPEFLLRRVGGSMTNAARLLTRLGMNCSIFGTIGADANGTIVIKHLNAIGMISFLRLAEHDTGIVNCFVTPDGERTMQTYVDRRCFTQEEVVPEAPFQNKKFVLIEGYTAYFGDRLEKVIERALQNQAKISLDLASLDVVDKFKPKLKACISQVDYLFGNEKEMLAFTDCKTVQEAVESFPLSLTVVGTIGPKGCWVKAGGKSVAVLYDAPIVQKVIDTTGAGDFFLGGFMFGVMNGKDTPACVTIARIAAGFVIQEDGAELPEDKWVEFKSQALKV